MIGILQTQNESYINHFLCFYAIDNQMRPLKTTTHAKLICINSISRMLCHFVFYSN